MAVNPGVVEVEIGVLSLDGVWADDPLVADALRRALAPALGERAAAAADAAAGSVAQEAS
jgi:hypothetical protein